MKTSQMVPRYKRSRTLSFRHITQALRRKRPYRVSVGTLLGLALLTLLLCWTRRYYNSSEFLPCRYLPGASDTVLIMKTGVTELEDRLPIHLETTLKCSPNSVIFSDHEELYQGKFQIRDVLANVDPALRRENEDFEIYRRVKAVGREGLEPADLTGRRSTSKTSKEQKIQIAGWVLDKWKFLPMLNETFHLYPDHKWYVFIETDTYLFWTTTLKYLSTLDHTKPHCLGHRSTVRSEHPFAHGGSGYVLSNPALRLLVDYIEENREELDDFVESEWAGDIALGLVLQEAGVPLTPVWPIYKPHHFGILDFGLIYEDKNFWCYPAGSFHHMTPDAIEDMWNFEQEWIQEENIGNDPNTVIRHGDVFSSHMMPRMRFPRWEWNNQCTTIKKNVQTVEDCNSACIEDNKCVQYLFDVDASQCNISDTVRFGEASLGSQVYSDWLFDRVEAWRDDVAPCRGESFIYPESVKEL